MELKVEECQRCKEVGEERRILWMSCCYEMDELGLPLTHIDPIRNDDVPMRFYTMRVCKTCRALWMQYIKLWFITPDNKKAACNSGIFVRELGATIEISREEWDKRAPGIEPCIFKE